MNGHGFHWSACRGGFHWSACRGGFDAGVLIQFAAIVVAAACAVMIIMEFAWLIVTVSVIATAIRLWLVYRRVAAIAAIEARGVLMREEQRVRDAAELVDRRRHELAVAAASATQVHITNTIDPAAILAAAFGAAPVQYQPDPVRVIRGELER